MPIDTNIYPFIELVVDNDYISKSMDLIGSAKSEIILSTFKIQTGRNKRTEVLRDMIQLLNDKLKDGIKIMLLLNWIKELQRGSTDKRAGGQRSAGRGRRRQIFKRRTLLPLEAVTYR